jgi:hypothetical protein
LKVGRFIVVVWVVCLAAPAIGQTAADSDVVRLNGADWRLPVATCLVNGEDLGATLVRQGVAWASLRQTWRYVFDDWVAWFDGKGIYAHGCEKPWEWRANNKAGR